MYVKICAGWSKWFCLTTGPYSCEVTGLGVSFADALAEVSGAQEQAKTYKNDPVSYSNAQISFKNKVGYRISYDDFFCPIFLSCAGGCRVPQDQIEFGIIPSNALNS